MIYSKEVEEKYKADYEMKKELECVRETTEDKYDDAGNYITTITNHYTSGGGEAVGFLDIGAGDDGAVLEHIFQVDQVAVVHVLCEVVGIVEVDQPLLVSLYDVGRQ